MNQVVVVDLQLCFKCWLKSTMSVIRGTHCREQSWGNSTSCQIIPHCSIPFSLVQQYIAWDRFGIALTYSILQGLPEGAHKDIVDIISSHITAVFSKTHPECDVSSRGGGQYSLAVGRRIDYLDVLMENFDLGESALRRQLPVGMSTSTIPLTLRWCYCCNILLQWWDTVWEIVPHWAIKIHPGI